MKFEEDCFGWRKKVEREKKWMWRERRREEIFSWALPLPSDLQTWHWDIFLRHLMAMCHVIQHHHESSSHVPMTNTHTYHFILAKYRKIEKKIRDNTLKSSELTNKIYFSILTLYIIIYFFISFWVYLNSIGRKCLI